MCGRYTQTRDPRELEQRFGVSMPDAARGGRYNIAPTEDILAVAASRETGRPEARVMTWGLWSKPVINVRSETVLEKPAFRKLAGLPGSRCLVLADGFYEWMKAERPKEPKQPFRFTVDGGAPFAFAGLCSRGTAAVLTCAPNPLVARLHDRMPVILGGPEEEAAWLAGGVTPEEAVAACVPLDAARMEAAPANRRVNKAGPEVEGPELLVPEPDRPAEDGAPRLFA
jgi:putative SOS response-associated peptidase YedK